MSKRNLLKESQFKRQLYDFIFKEERKPHLTSHERWCDRNTPPLKMFDTQFGKKSPTFLFYERVLKNRFHSKIR